MGASASSKVQLVLEGLDFLSSPLGKAKGSLIDFKNEFKKAGNEMRSISQQLSRIDRLGRLAKGLEADEKALVEVNEQLAHFEMFIKKGIMAADAMPEKLISLRREKERLTAEIKKSKHLMEDETKILKEQGIAVDKLDDEYARLKKQKTDMHDKQKKAQADADAQKKKDQARQDRMDKGKEQLAKAAGYGASAFGAFELLKNPVQEAMKVQEGVNEIIAKGLFDQRETLTPEAKKLVARNLSDQALRMGAELPGFSGLDVLKLQQTAITGGTELKDLTDQFIRDILQYAILDKMSPEEAFNSLESIRKTRALYDPAYNDRKKLKEISDVLTFGTLKASMDTRDMAAVFEEAAAPGSMVNVSERDIVSLAAVLADKANIKGPKSATMIKNILTSLTSPDNETAKKLKEMHLNFGDEHGNMIPIAQVFRLIGNKTKGWGNMPLSKLLGGIGNQEGITAMSTFVRMATTEEGFQDLQMIENEFKKALEGKGKNSITDATKNVTAGLTEGLTPALEELSGAFSNLKVAIGMDALEDLEKLVRMLTNGLEELTNWFKDNPLAAKTAFWSVAAAGIGFLGAAVTTAAAAIATFTGISGAAVALWVGGAALIGGTAVAIVGHWDNMIERLKKSWEGMKQWWIDETKFIRDFFKWMDDLFPDVEQKSDQSALQPIKTMSDPDFQKQYREAEAERTKNVFGASPSNMARDISLSAPVTVTINGNADPDKVAQEVQTRVREQFDEFMRQYQNRLFD